MYASRYCSLAVIPGNYTDSDCSMFHISTRGLWQITSACAVHRNAKLYWPSPTRQLNPSFQHQARNCNVKRRRRLRSCCARITTCSVYTCTSSVDPPFSLSRRIHATNALWRISLHVVRRFRHFIPGNGSRLYPLRETLQSAEAGRVRGRFATLT